MKTPFKTSLDCLSKLMASLPMAEGIEMILKVPSNSNLSMNFNSHKQKKPWNSSTGKQILSSFWAVLRFVNQKSGRKAWIQ